MHAASANPHSEDDWPKTRENALKKAAEEEGAEIAEAPETFCSHCTMLLKHNGGIKAIASAHTRMTMDLMRINAQCQIHDKEGLLRNIPSATVVQREPYSQTHPCC
jgi:hypothetical protein